MQRNAAFAAKWSGTIGLLALGSALAGCGHGGGGYGEGSGDPPPTVSLAANPAAIALGQSATLTWMSNPGTSCQASGAWDGPEPANGTAEVTPTATGAMTYTLTCSGGAYSGNTTRTVTLTVEPASTYTTTSLVEDFAGGAAVTTDAHLVNPWGIAYAPASVIWVANNHSETSTLYTGSGTPAPTAANPLVVQLEDGAGGVSFDPTGLVFSASANFVVSRGGLNDQAIFAFAGEGGMIAGWSPALDVVHAITMYTAADGAVYKGLTIANDGGESFLYATDFANGKVDVFGATFEREGPTAASFTFDDPTLPEGYAPFGIQAINNGAEGATQIYVSYAKRDEGDPEDDAPGPGLGLVNVFDTHGNLLKHLVTEGGKLNSPWGMALAPADFGTLSNALLVGNFGDGTIHGYDPSTGRYVGAVVDAAGAEFAVPGLWGMLFGNDAANQPHATLFFAAGNNDEANGLYGRIDLGDATPALGVPPVVSLGVPEGDLTGTVTLTADVVDALAVTNVRFLLNGNTAVGTATSAPFSVQWDTTAVSNGGNTLRAVATDANGNVGSSAIMAVNVANTAAATLTQLQQAVFTPSCSACHDGSQPANGALPGAMNLRSGASFGSLVNVASREQPALMRVKPGEPENSYLIHKLEGTQGISGARMPFGGPFLDAATIDQVKSWIASGAPNN
jgi:uncharacterized protein (TIGR03118 family)